MEIGYALICQGNNFTLCLEPWNNVQYQPSDKKKIGFDQQCENIMSHTGWDNENKRKAYCMLTLTTHIPRVTTLKPSKLLDGIAFFWVFRRDEGATKLLWCFLSLLLNSCRCFCAYSAKVKDVIWIWKACYTCRGEEAWVDFNSIFERSLWS